MGPMWLVVDLGGARTEGGQSVTAKALALFRPPRGDRVA